MKAKYAQAAKLIETRGLRVATNLQPVFPFALADGKPRVEISIFLHQGLAVFELIFPSCSQVIHIEGLWESDEVKELRAVMPLMPSP